MNIHEVRTEQDLKQYLAQQQQRIDETDKLLTKLKAQSQVSKLERVEDRIELLASQGMDYGAAFELAVSELEEDEHKAQTRAEQAQAKRVDLELEQMSEAQEQRLLEELED